MVGVLLVVGELVGDGVSEAVMRAFCVGCCVEEDNFVCRNERVIVGTVAGLCPQDAINSLDKNMTHHTRLNQNLAKGFVCCIYFLLDIISNQEYEFSSLVAPVSIRMSIIGRVNKIK
jgi:hypothetical protein